ncbi:MAG TPA: type I-U CRISPR-associated protein Csb2, partial [Deltaproteobacteria bacterium]|nr:type I-U CRISPR-associated protein Csb2 [Deltaproteobacteria bacterium]
MVTIRLNFHAGRFHATPWGRNVNEGVPEWPPSTYRLARALVDVWKRRFPEWPEERLSPVFELFSRPASYHLPAAVPSHTRSYLHSNAKDPEKKQLVFDPFVALSREAFISIGFDGDLPSGSLKDLAALLAEMNYLGRSESWVHASLSDKDAAAWNCRPIEDGYRPAGRIVPVACVLSPDRYAELPHKPLRVIGKGKAGKTAPVGWLGALCMTTDDLHRSGWSDPPALRWVSYDVPDFVARFKTERPAHAPRLHVAKYALSSTVLPRVQETVAFSERVRGHLMGIHRKIMKDPSLVSPIFSGKDPEGRPQKGHRHAYYWPLDEDGDGRIDHLLVKSAEPFKQSELDALDRLRSVWQSDGRPDVSFVLVSLSADMPAGESRRWVSATPFVTARHYRKGRGTYGEWLESEVRRECVFQGLPEPAAIAWIPDTSSSGRSVCWWEFLRSRKDRQAMRG